MVAMLGYPESHKQAVRLRILKVAAEELRRNGLTGIGIPALMKRAGLIHGAFSTHCPNRDALDRRPSTSRSWRPWGVRPPCCLACSPNA